MRTAALGLTLVALLLAGLWWSLAPDGPGSPRPPGRSDESAGAAVTRAPPTAPPARTPPGPAETPAPSPAVGSLTADEPRLTLTLRTLLRQHRWSVRAEPLPTRVAVGATDADGAPGEPLVTIETDGDGRAQVVLPRSVVRGDPDQPARQLWLRATDPEFLDEAHRLDVPDGEETLSQVLYLARRAVVEGTLRGPDGEPCAGQVTAWIEAADGSGTTRAHLANVGADGRLHGVLTDAGRVRLHASAWRGRADADRQWLGTTVSAPRELRFGETTAPFMLTAAGPGLLRGRLLDGRGEPAAGVPLIALCASLDPDEIPAEAYQERTQELEAQGRGRHRADTITDSEGRFELTGLRHDLWHLRARPTRSLSDAWGVRLTDVPLPADGVPRELTFGRPHLAIHVRTADGAPAEAVAPRELPRRRWSEGFDDWPAEPALQVCLSREHDVETEDDRHLRPLTVGPGEFVVELAELLASTPAATVELGLTGGAQPWTPTRVELAGVTGRVDVELVLADSPPPGTLVLDVTDSLGTPLHSDLAVRLVDPVTGQLLLEVPTPRHDPEDWPLRLPLPAATYRLEVEGQASIDSHHGTVWQRRLHGGWSGEVTVQPGQDLVRTVRLEDPARLSLRLLGTADDADRAVAEERWARAVNRTDEAVAAAAASIVLRLERPGHAPVIPWFVRRAFAGTSAAGSHRFSGFALGGEGLSEALTPGRYTLVGRSPGGRERRVEVELLPGRTTEATLSFD